jgi:Zn-dependent protease with chaperone function
VNPDFFLISALIDFVLLNAVFSTLSMGVERLSRAYVHAHWSGRRRSRFLFLLSVLPFVFSGLIIGGLQVPAQLLYEPHEPTEYVTLKIFALGLVGLLGIGYAVMRQLASWWMTRRFRLQAIRISEPLDASVLPTPLPVFRIRHALPLCCIFGFRRPELFLADQLFRALNVSELRGALAHEEAHARQGDNLKYLCLSVLKNFFFFLPTYRHLVEGWRDANEFACDEEASERTSEPLELAGALVKIAKLAPPGHSSPSTLLSGLGLTDFSSSARLEQRIKRLLSLADGIVGAEVPWRPSIIPWLTCVGSFAALAIFLVRHNLLYWFHQGVEVLERFFM